VIGGTLAAVLISSPLADLKRAAGFLRLIFDPVTVGVKPTIDEIARIATIARKEGVLAIEAERQRVADPLLKKTLKFVIDGFDPVAVREIIGAEIERARGEEERSAGLFERAARFAMGFGVLGAALGLISAAPALGDLPKAASGISAALASVLYGWAAAHWLLLPCAVKIRRKAEQRALVKEVVRAGVVGILEGLNPHLLQERLGVFSRDGA
jgi:chemotaxis protein MotA